MASGETRELRRWDPSSRTYTSWDGLRRDQELWSYLPDRVCLVHLYGKGRSKRGPSIRIPLDALKAARCTMALSEYAPAASGVSPRSSYSSSSDSGYSSSIATEEALELFIPAPEATLREDTLRWHVTTRNFFAWMNDTPLVGTSLGQALVDLLERMPLFRVHEANNVEDLLSYARRVGYLNFAHHPDYALAFLYFAERFKLRDLWIEAFTHCAGQKEVLHLSTELDSISPVTKALITRAFLEMDLHLGRVSRGLRTFLEEELSPTNFGFSAGAYAHLERFRSFLQSYYASQCGYWPPQEGSNLSKSLTKSMHSEFSALYELLADKGSYDMTQESHIFASGGICVLQNITAFNLRHKYEPLPFSLPLLPDCQSPTSKVVSQKHLRHFSLGRSTAGTTHTAIQSALAVAANTLHPAMRNDSLVKAYVQFERDCVLMPDEKVTTTDARKVRWIMIYSILQMLTSVAKAPKEVRSPDDACYHMCILTTGLPPWAEKNVHLFQSDDIPRDEVESPRALIEGGLDTDPVPEPASPTMSIHPDCESDDYFAQLPMRSNSGSSLKPKPLRVASGSIKRFNSLRSFRRSTLNKSRRATMTVARTPSLLNTVSPQRDLKSIHVVEVYIPSTSVRSPTVEGFMLDDIRRYAADLDLSNNDNSVSPSSQAPSTYSSDESVSTDNFDSISWISGDDSRRRSDDIQNMDHESVTGGSRTPNRSSIISVYVRKPSGAPSTYDSSTTSASPLSLVSSSGSLFADRRPATTVPTSRFSVLRPRAPSAASSVYPDEPMQACDIREGQSDNVDAKDLVEAQALNLPMWWNVDDPDSKTSSGRASPSPFFCPKQDVAGLDEAVVVDDDYEDDGDYGDCVSREADAESVIDRDFDGANEAPDVEMQVDIFGAMALLPLCMPSHVR